MDSYGAMEACGVCRRSEVRMVAEAQGLRRPVVRLVGEDGNAFAILGRVQLAMREAGWPKAAIDAFKAEATAGNYYHLLATVMEHVTEASTVDGSGGEDG